MPLPRINQKNFAINGRIYDTSLTTPLLNPNLYQLSTKETTPGQTLADISAIGSNPTNVNTQTAFGYPWFH